MYFHKLCTEYSRKKREESNTRRAPIQDPDSQVSKRSRNVPFFLKQKSFLRPCEEETVEAAQRPTMSFVAAKTEEQQARGMLFQTRDLLARQRTRSINALRGHLAESGVVAPRGAARIDSLASALEAPGAGLPKPVRFGVGSSRGLRSTDGGQGLESPGFGIR